MKALQSNPKVVSKFSISDHKLYFKERVMILEDDKLQSEILFELHDTLVGGHRDYLKTLSASLRALICSISNKMSISMCRIVYNVSRKSIIY